VSIYRIDKEEVVHINNGILLSHKKEIEGKKCNGKD